MSTALVHRFRSNKDVLGFALFATLISALLLGLYLALPRTLLDPFEVFTARAVAGLLQGIGIAVTCNGNVISSAAYSIRVIDECLGIEILLLSAAFVMVFPAPWRKKLLALAVGFPILLMVNALRMVMLFLISTFNRTWFDYAHIYLGQFMMLFVVVFLFLIWLASLNKGNSLPTKRWFIIRLMLTSSLFFLLWSFLQKPYVGLSESMLSIIAQYITGVPSQFNEKATYDYTFGIATFLSLFFAEKQYSFSKRLLPLVSGIMILFLFHMFFRILAVFAFMQKGGVPYSMSVGVYAFSTILLPLLLWLAFRKTGRTLKKCPYCGKEKSGLLEHIRKKHGEEALNKCADKGVIMPNGNEIGFL
jgi:exosortase H (IPTLxxWG-CTERM-specific)